MDKIRLFTVGPVNMFGYSLELSAKQIPYFRTKEFSQVVYEINGGLKEMTDAPDGAETVLLTASGSGAMEAVVQCLDKNRKALVIKGGSFGERFEKLCLAHDVPCDTVNIDFGVDLTDETLAEYEGKDYQALLVNIHETSIGKYYSPAVLKNFAEKNGCYLIIDAISSFLADEYSMKEFGADVTIISSQKALALYPGLSAVVFSRRFYDDRIAASTADCVYLDLKDGMKDALRGQTPYTPALNVIYQLQQRLAIIRENGGAAYEIARTRKLAEYFRQEAVKLGYGLPDYRLSNCLTPIICPRNNAEKIFETLKNKYDIFLTPCGGANRDRLLRVGHIGDLGVEDYDILLEKLKEEDR